MPLKPLTRERYNNMHSHLINIVEKEGYIKHHYFAYWYKFINDLEYRYTFNHISYKLEVIRGVKPILISGYYYNGLLPTSRKTERTEL